MLHPSKKKLHVNCYCVKVLLKRLTASQLMVNLALTCDWLERSRSVPLPVKELKSLNCHQYFLQHVEANNPDSDFMLLLGHLSVQKCQMYVQVLAACCYEILIEHFVPAGLHW